MSGGVQTDCGHAVFYDLQGIEPIWSRERVLQIEIVVDVQV